MTILDELTKHGMLSDVITLEFGLYTDNNIGVLLNDEEILILPTNLECHKFSLEYRLEDYELEEFKETLKLLKKLTDQILKFKLKRDDV